MSLLHSMPAPSGRRCPPQRRKARLQKEILCLVRSRARLVDDSSPVGCHSPASSRPMSAVGDGLQVRDWLTVVPGVQQDVVVDHAVDEYLRALFIVRAPWKNISILSLGGAGHHCIDRGGRNAGAVIRRYIGQRRPTSPSFLLERSLYQKGTYCATFAPRHGLLVKQYDNGGNHFSAKTFPE